MLKYDELKKKPREFLAATGLTPEEFEKLLPAFERACQREMVTEHTLEGKRRQRKTGAGTKGKLRRLEDRLLFTLVYEKTSPLQTMHGLQFGLSQGPVNYWIHRLLPLVQEALQERGHAPERAGEALTTSTLAQEADPEWVIDGTERRQQRPHEQTEPKKYDSGKKKAPTLKNILLIHEHTRKVIYLSPTIPGKTHDKKAAEEAQIRYPVGTTLSKDTGFQGYEPEGVLTRQPKKKPRGKEWSVGEKWLNSILSSARVVVEHGIAGVKRCRIVKDVLRLTREGIGDRVMEVACGWHNLRVSCRHPFPSFDLFRPADALYS